MVQTVPNGWYRLKEKRFFSYHLAFNSCFLIKHVTFTLEKHGLLDLQFCQHVNGAHIVVIWCLFDFFSSAPHHCKGKWCGESNKGKDWHVFCCVSEYDSSLIFNGRSVISPVLFLFVCLPQDPPLLVQVLFIQHYECRLTIKPLIYVIYTCLGGKKVAIWI